MAKSTKKIASFNPSNLDQVRKIMEEKLKELKDLGISFNIGNMRYTEKSFHVKLECAIIDENNEIRTPIENKCYENLKRFGSSFDVDEKLFGKKVDFKGEKVKFIGLNIRKVNRQYTFLLNDGRILSTDRNWALSRLTSN